MKAKVAEYQAGQTAFDERKAKSNGKMKGEFKGIKIGVGLVTILEYVIGQLTLEFEDEQLSGVVSSAEFAQVVEAAGELVNEEQRIPDVV